MAVSVDRGQTRLFINGEYRTSGWLTPEVNLLIPSYEIGTTSEFSYGQHQFKGSLDEVRIWGTNLISQDVQANLFRELRAEGDLKVHFDFNEGIPYGINTNVDAPVNGVAYLGFSMKPGAGSNYVFGAEIENYDADNNGTGDFCADPSTVLDDDGDGIRNNLDDCDEEPLVGIAFDGVGDYIEIPNNSSLAPTSSQVVTFEAWIRPTVDRQMIIASMYKDFNVGASNFYIRRDFGGTITVTGNGTDVITSYETVPVGSWTHLRVEFGSSATIFLNGSVSRSLPITYNTTNGGRPLILGDIHESGGSFRFQGDMDEVRIWQGTQGADRNAILTGNEPGLLAYFDASEGALNSYLGDITTLTDKTGNGHDGTFVNFDERGLKLDGIDDRIELPDNDAIDFPTNQDFTIELWVNVPSAAQPNTAEVDVSLIEKWDGVRYSYTIRYLKPQKKIVVARYDGSNSASIVSSSTFNDDQWHHVAFVKDGGTLRLYVDGLQEGTSPDWVSGTVTNDGVVTLGSRSASLNFKGALDELRFWNVARTPTQITDNMNIGLSGSESGLVGYYPFEEPVFYGVGYPSGGVIDKSPTANDGTPFGLSGQFDFHWVGGAPVSGTDSDGDGVGDRCDLCQGDDSTGDTDMDGICDDIDPDTPVTCDGSVISIDAITYSLSGDDVRASETITTNGSVIVPDGAEVTYTAGTSITLKPGFQAQGIFTARIDDCSSVVQTSVPSEEDAMTTIDWRIPDEEIGELDMLLFPNPTFGEVTTQYFLPEGGPVNLVLFDAQGRYVKSLMENWPQDAGRHQVQWQTNRLADGMYWVQIRTTSGVRVEKLMVYKP